ncbi:HK97-gp10 family putative phage morphogenesis protein [Rouxiella chamberiensis]|uniref:HK97 gp10 family phage protein n=1 Tax=Rouxiella chamberiensis TaxID=1513468 RepID=A0ABY7HQ49_9GAMM|nr:HK97-gp10 family putative phage morphogenesis protein [Rouxiella chamberiensis]WAT01519.1 HK97 gp10 family phage protein [Rouxiella chamberiensis]
MIGANLDFGDLLRLTEDLDTLSKSETKQVLNKAARAGAEVLRAAVENNAPVRTGKLKRNVVVLSRKSGPGEAVAGVHIRGTNPSGTNSDTTTKGSSQNNAFYWRFIELGTSKMPANPFVRPAYDTNQELAAQAGFDMLNAAIDEVLSK